MDLRLGSAVTVYFLAVLGIFLAVAPWTGVWDYATLTLLPTWCGGWIRSGWFRGAVTGLGALDLLAAAQESRVLWRSLRDDRSG